MNNKIYKVYVYNIDINQIVSYEMFDIEAENKNIAWDKAINMVFDNLFSTNKMIMISEKKEIELF